MEHVDIAILGAGAAGLFCAGSILQLAKRPMRVLVLDHARKAAEKIRISGGGRCNFTNLATSGDRFLSNNPRFSASALAGFTPRDFVRLVDEAGIAWHEKTEGQLFCDDSARPLIDMLLSRARGAQLRLETSITAVRQQSTGFILETPNGDIAAERLIVATGGKSIPKIGASSFGYALAQQFGLRLVDTRAGLVPLTFAQQDLDLCKPLAGISVAANVRCGKVRFNDGLLFTHRGLSGPAILQISSYWQAGETIHVNLAGDIDVATKLKEQRQSSGKSMIATALSNYVPARVAEAALAELKMSGRVADQSNAALVALGNRINDWAIKPVGSEGYRTAEVTVGGVDTRDIDARDMQARRIPGLYFIGEVLDVTGWLGGYNFQWAWASAHAAAKGIVGTNKP